MQCLQKLPADQREVIVLKIWHEHTFEEIAELLQLSPNTVAGRYRYGMDKMRKFMGDSGEEDRVAIRQGDEKIRREDSRLVSLSPLVATHGGEL